MLQLAAQFGCGKTQILNTLAQKDRYIREWEVMGRNNPSIGARKRFRHTRNEQINRSVHEWYQQQVATGLRVTGPMLQRQARHYAAHSGIVNFAASNGWLANFRRFYNIVSVSNVFFSYYLALYLVVFISDSSSKLRQHFLRRLVSINCTLDLPDQKTVLLHFPSKLYLVV